jgi:hypothetical protein
MNSVYSGHSGMNCRWRYIPRSICRSDWRSLFRSPLILSLVWQIRWWDSISVTSLGWRFDCFAERLGIRCVQGRIFFILVPVWLTLSDSIHTSYCHIFHDAVWIAFCLCLYARGMSETRRSRCLLCIKNVRYKYILSDICAPSRFSVENRGASLIPCFYNTGVWVRFP